MKRHLYLLWLDILFALPVLVFYLLWDMREIERDLTTARHLVLATALAVLVGLPLRFLYHHLPFRVAEVYARAVWLSAGILMYSGWVGLQYVGCTCHVSLCSNEVGSFHVARPNMACSKRVLILLRSAYSLALVCIAMLK